MKTINVLSIGNSFSQDAQRYLHDLAASEGVSMETMNLYIGGCPLECHFRNMAGDRKAYMMQVDGHQIEGFLVRMDEALTSRNWDVITLQQASHFSFQEDSYFPYIEELAEYVRYMCPKAKLLIHQTWGYETGSARIIDHGFQTYDDMFKEVKVCYEKAAEAVEADGIIPCGEALQYALHHGAEKVHRDTLHAGLGMGRFILALVWYGYITGNDVRNVKFDCFDVEVTEEEYKIALEAAASVLER